MLTDFPIPKLGIRPYPNVSVRSLEGISDPPGTFAPAYDNNWQGFLNSGRGVILDITVENSGVDSKNKGETQGVPGRKSLRSKLRKPPLATWTRSGKCGAPEFIGEVILGVARLVPA